MCKKSKKRRKKVNIILDTTGYTPIDILVADALIQPNFFKSRFEELKGRLTSSTKDFYESFFDEAIDKAKATLAKKVEDGGFDGVMSNIRVSTSLNDVRGDVFVSVTIQAIALKKMGELV